MLLSHRSPGTVAASKVYVLPAADGDAGQSLSTNGAAVLAWGSPEGGGDVMASANLSDLANLWRADIITAVEHGLVVVSVFEPSRRLGS